MLKKKNAHLILNIEGSISKKIELDKEKTYLLRTSNKKIKNNLKDFLTTYNLLKIHDLPDQDYLIRGGSSISGCPMHHSISGNIALKIFSKGKSKKQRKMPKTITDKIRVLDILATPTQENTQT